MTSQRSSFRAVAAVLVVLVPIVAGAILLYVSFLNSRTSYLTGKRYRALANSADELRESVAGLTKAYDTALSSYGTTMGSRPR